MFVELARQSGAFVTTLPSFGAVADKLASLFSPSSAQMVYVMAKPEDLERLADWLSDGMETPVDSTFPVRKIDEALSRYEQVIS